MGIIGGIGLGELLIILFIILLFFGIDKLPELAKAMGKSVREFKRAMQPEEKKTRKKKKTKKSKEKLAG
jgi:sec-independent protein translocase protein TatA